MVYYFVDSYIFFIYVIVWHFLAVEAVNLYPSYYVNFLLLAMGWRW